MSSLLLAQYNQKFIIIIELFKEPTFGFTDFLFFFFFPIHFLFQRFLLLFLFSSTDFGLKLVFLFLAS